MVTQPACFTEGKGADSSGPIHHTKALYSLEKCTIFSPPHLGNCYCGCFILSAPCLERGEAFSCLLHLPHLAVILPPLQSIHTHLFRGQVWSLAPGSGDLNHDGPLGMSDQYFLSLELQFQFNYPGHWGMHAAQRHCDSMPRTTVISKILSYCSQ